MTRMKVDFRAGVEGKELHDLARGALKADTTVRVALQCCRLFKIRRERHPVVLPAE